MSEFRVLPDGAEVELTDEEIAERDAARAEHEAVLAEVAARADQIEEATAIRDTLALLVVTPVAQRDPADTALAMQGGSYLAVTTVGTEDPDLIRLTGECSSLAIAALLPRLAPLLGPQS